jgi:hypothetical protein
MKCQAMQLEWCSLFPIPPPRRPCTDKNNRTKILEIPPLAPHISPAMFGANRRRIIEKSSSRWSAGERWSAPVRNGNIQEIPSDAFKKPN